MNLKYPFSLSENDGYNFVTYQSGGCVTRFNNMLCL